MNDTSLTKLDKTSFRGDVLVLLLRGLNADSGGNLSSILSNVNSYYIETYGIIYDIE